MQISDRPIHPCSTSNGGETWNRYQSKMLSLALRTIRSEFDFDLIVGIGPGGSYVADTFSRYFDKDIALLMTEGDRCANKITVIGNKLYSKALLLQGRTDNEELLKTSEQILKEKYPGIKVKTAAVFKKNSGAYPHLFEENVDSNKEVKLPNEIFKEFKNTFINKKFLDEILLQNTFPEISEDQKFIELARSIFQVLLNHSTQNFLNEQSIPVIREKYSEGAKKCCKNPPAATVSKVQNPSSEKELYEVSWSHYEVNILALALKLIHSDFIPDYIIAIARGGVPVGSGLSEALQRPLGMIVVSSYLFGKKTPGQIYKADDLSMLTEELSGNVLVVDELVETGTTLKMMLEDLKNRFPKIETIKGAVIFEKPTTKIKPEYRVETIDSNKWIVFPNEQGERLRSISKDPELLKFINMDKIGDFANAIIRNLPADPREGMSLETIQELAGSWK